jgi:hypothetical protein
MQLVSVAARAVLLPLDALGVQALVLGGEVIAVFTIAACENDFVSRHFSLCPLRREVIEPFASLLSLA